ncbi:MAG: RNA methyltransferase [Lentisphaeria bacterium]|nr:RNA methyltransferase [Lentisphaeria bacterium]
MDELTKKEIALIQALYTRHGRKKYPYCIVEGVRSCSEFFARVPEMAFFSVANSAETAQNVKACGDIRIVPESVFNKISGTMNSQGILVVSEIPAMPDASEINKDDFILALDKVGDPGNFGTICRTAKAAGLTEIWYTKGSVDPFSDKVIRSAMTAQFLLKMRVFETLADLRDEAVRQGFCNVCLTKPGQGSSCFTTEGVFDKSVVVIGSEGHGVSELDNSVDVQIPMPGNFESLNAAQAATILIFEYVRRKESKLKL